MWLSRSSLYVCIIYNILFKLSSIAFSFFFFSARLLSFASFSFTSFSHFRLCFVSLSFLSLYFLLFLFSYFNNAINCAGVTYRTCSAFFSNSICCLRVLLLATTGFLLHKMLQRLVTFSSPFDLIVRCNLYQDFRSNMNQAYAKLPTSPDRYSFILKWRVAIEFTMLDAKVPVGTLDLSSAQGGTTLC